MNILAIGNSFSQDALRYLHNIAKSDNYDLTVVNLYIGGCPLSQHYKNMLEDNKTYLMEFNGQETLFYVSIKEALLSRDWDYISLQQVSNQSIDYETYQPYLNELSAYIKKYAPKAKQIIHQTWSYEEINPRLHEELGYKNQLDMFHDLKTAYEKAAKEISAEFIIPSGELFQNLLNAGIKKVHRDTLHVTLGLGRYALGLLWYSILTKNDIKNNTFNDFDEPISQEEIEIIKNCVMKTVKGE